MGQIKSDIFLGKWHKKFAGVGRICPWVPVQAMESSTEYLSLALPMPATAGAYGRSTDEGLQMIGIRRLIIKTAEILMIVLVVLTILGFAVSGAIAGGQTNAIVAAIGLIVGGFVGLVIAAVTASFFFLILEIAENTRRPL